MNEEELEKKLIIIYLIIKQKFNNNNENIKIYRDDINNSLFNNMSNLCQK